MREREMGDETGPSRGGEGEPLTRREREILALLAEGLTSPEIADRLVLATSSVKSHMQHLYGKLGANSKRQAVARARALGLLPPAGALPAAPLPAPQSDTPPRLRHNLPRQVTRLFGREREIEQLVALMAEHPLVTLTGAGGVGKTRLSLAAAGAVLDDFPDGVWWVELAALADSALVPHQVASALRVPDEPGRSALENLMAHLREREALVVLNNCEHLLDACARLAERLLQPCPRLRILGTSREPLAIYGEAIFRVPSLPFPDTPEAFDHINEFAAVSLFIDRARLALPDYQLAAHNAAAIGRICQRLDGIPLAIEMAAARVNLLSAEQLAERLDNAFAVLTVGSRTALPRHQTLRATVDWSYQLLPEAERLLLQRLAVFAGGCTLEAAEAVCTGDGLAAGQVLDVLGSLVAKSMVIADRSAGQAARYHLLETIRQYAWRMVGEAGEAEALRARHLDYFVILAEAAEPELKGPAQMVWLDRLEAELDNLRAAVEHSLATGESCAQGLRLLVALNMFWDVRCHHHREAHDWLKAGLAGHTESGHDLLWARASFAAARLAYEPADVARMRSDMEASARVFRAAGLAGRYDLAYALVNLGILVHNHLGDFTIVVALLEESIVLFRELGDKWGLAEALGNLAGTRDPLVNYLPRPAPGLPPPLPVVAPALRNDHTAERALFEESLALFREVGDRLSYGNWLQPCTYMFFCAGDVVSGRALMQESLAIQRENGVAGGVMTCLMFLGIDALTQEDLEGATVLIEECAGLIRSLQEPTPAWINFLLGEVARRRGDYRQASKLATAALVAYQRWGNPELVAASLDEQARIAWSQGDYASARSLEMKGLAVRLAVGHPICLGSSFHALAVLAAVQQQPERAARLFGAAEPYRPALLYYHRCLPIWPAEHERSVAAVRAQLGEDSLAKLWAEGEAWTLEQAVAFARSNGE